MWFTKNFNKLIAILFLLTLIAVFSKNYILSSTFSILPSSNYITHTYDDSNSGGDSSVKQDNTNDYFQWHCHLKPTITFPYCGYEIVLGQQWPVGIDFSDYTSIRLWLEYEGNGKSVRLNLRNYDERYSNINDYSSSKFNEVEIGIDQLNEGVNIDLRHFVVPKWWKNKYNISINNSAPEFNNVVYIDFQSGSNIKGGVHHFKLKRIDVIGQWLSTENWFFSLIILWLLLGAAWIVNSYIALKKTVELGNKREKELLEINSVLDTRTQELTVQTKQDKLTGAFNRQGVEDAISLALIEWQEENKPLSIIMLDIDHFKHINDQYGHAVGDNVLTALTQLVQKNIRSTDRFARWGGEEFVLICRNTELIEAYHLAENLRQKLSSKNIVDDISITASFGVANIKNNNSIKALFKQGDDALYRAKNKGRNTVELETLS